MSETSGGLGRASVSNIAWNASTFGLSKLVVLVTTIILARLLDPTDFGLVGIGLLVLAYLDLVNDFGINAAVIQHRGDPEHTANVAFWLNMALGLVLTAAGIVGAPLVGAFFDDERAVDVVRVLSLSFLITSLGAIHEARLRRDLRFRRRVLPEVGRGVSKGAVAITLAFAGAGVWSLVWGQLAGALTAALLYWVAYPWRPRFVVDRRTTRELVGFGSQITLLGVVGTLVRNIDYVIVGRWLGTRALGLYTLAFRMPQLLVEGVATITGQVVFPAFSRIQSEPARLRSALRKVLGTTSLLIVPLGLGLALVADPFVRVAYGERWVPAIRVMQLLSVYMVIQAASRNCGDLYKGIGRAGLLNVLAVVKLAVTVPLLALGAQRGIVEVAFAQVIAASIATALDLVVAARVIGLPLGSLLSTFAPAVRAGSVMVLACAGVLALLADAGPVAQLIGVVVVGAVAYAGALLILDRPVVDEVRRLITRSAGRPVSGTADATTAVAGGGAR